jgi:hypothetical protein
MGECWHDIYVHCSQCEPYCRKCKQEYVEQNNFSTWEGFGRLWEWSQRQRWWRAFRRKATVRVGDNGCDTYEYQEWEHLINPDRFADAVYAYLKEVGDE